MSATGPGNRWLNTVTRLGIFIVVTGILIALVGLAAWLLGRGGVAPSTLEVTSLGLKLETSALAILVLTIGIITALLGLGLLIAIVRHHMIPEPQVPVPMPRGIAPAPTEDFTPPESIDVDRSAGQFSIYAEELIMDELRRDRERRGGRM